MYMMKASTDVKILTFLLLRKVGAEAVGQEMDL